LDCDALNCTLSGNRSTGSAGALLQSSFGGNAQSNWTNCTFVDNQATGDRTTGGVNNLAAGGFPSEIRLNNCTIAENQVSGGSNNGSGIFSLDFGGGALVLLKNTIVADNIGAPQMGFNGPAAHIISLGNNLWSDNSAIASAPSDLTNTEPL